MTMDLLGPNRVRIFQNSPQREYCRDCGQPLRRNDQDLRECATHGLSPNDQQPGYLDPSLPPPRLVLMNFERFLGVIGTKPDSKDEKKSRAT